MLIRSTKRLFSELDVKANGNRWKVDPLFTWEADVDIVAGEKLVILTNEKNGFQVALYGLRTVDFENFDVLFKHAVKEIFRANCIDKRIINRYLEDSGKTQYETLHQGLIRRVKTRIMYGSVEHDDVIPYKFVQFQVAKRNNVDKGSREKMFRDLKEYYGTDIFGCRAFVLEISFMNEKRKIVVPSAYTFGDLHLIIQKIYGLEESSLYRFEVIDDDSKKVSVVSHKAFFTGYNGSEKATFFNLNISEFVGISSDFMYTHNFNEGKHHKIRVVDTIEHYKQYHSECLFCDSGDQDRLVIINRELKKI